MGKVQDGFGRKIGDLIQYLFQAMASLIIAFYFNWKIALVLLCAIPFCAAAGAFMINSITVANHQSFEQYAKAGGLATEALNAIRTVTSLNIQPKIISLYRKYLFNALNIGIRKGLNVGLGNGLFNGVSFLTYALGFWYGGTLVAHDMIHNCHGNQCVTGGDVIIVFFAVMVGSLAFGQVRNSSIIC